MRKVYIVGGDQYSEYVNWVIPMGFEITKDLALSDLVFFCGGSDVNPAVYGHKCHHTTYYNDARDKEEIAIFNKAIEMGKKMWGTCRGSQALCAFQKNGYLIQHSNHPGYHKGVTKEGDILELTSSHHQMAGIDKLNCELLVWAENLSDYHYLGDGTDIKVEKEPEIVYYRDIKAVGSQSHVEWQYNSLDIESQKTVKYHQDLLLKLMDGHI